MNNCGNAPYVCVMLASYNGEKFIREQIDSILCQEAVRIKLIIRDDGSKDNTLKIAEEYKMLGNTEILTGQNVGPANNFFELLQIAPDAEYYAWADQDDIWDTDKLKIAVEMIRKIDDKPALYYSASRTVDKNNNYLATIGADSPSLSYGAALIRSKAQGATFVFNRQLLDIVKIFCPDFKSCGILHDAWLHRVCLAVGGVVIHDPNPHMSYRIHGNNVVAKISTNKMRDRIATFLNDTVPNYSSVVAEQIFEGYKSYLPKENYKLTYDLAYYRVRIKCKLKVLASSEYKVGVFKEDLKFKIKILLNKA